MKSGTVEFQHSVNRQKVSNRIFNGGDSVPLGAAQVNSAAAAYHDHIFSRTEKQAYNPETPDHIYASERGVPADNSKESGLQNTILRDMVISHLEIISHLQDELDRKSRQVYSLLDDNEKLAARVARSDRRMCLLRCQERVPPFLATRYFGRKSKTIPSRALKRRYMGPPKNFHLRQPLLVGPEGPLRLGVTNDRGEKPGVKKRRRKAGYLTTDRAYYLPEPRPEVTPTTPHIDVPLWKLKPVTSFYQMEGTENINDPVFERRHQKYELDERRRKRWDLQRLREQRAKTERLRQKRERGERSNPVSFLPDPRQVEGIDVTERLPVLAFGHRVPNFQPCEFSLSWMPPENCVMKKRRRGRPSSSSTVT